MIALIDFKNKQIMHPRRRSAVQQSWFCLILLFAISQIALSQTINVSGIITSSGNDITVPVRYAMVTFTDQNDPSKTFSTITDSAGKYELSIVTKVTPQPFVLPKNIELEQNYPNPFSSSTVISYKLNKQSDVSIKIFDILGREVRAMKIGSQMLGTHQLVWDGKDNYGNKLATGIYFYQLQTGSETFVKKMIYGLGGMEVNLPMPKAIPSYRTELKKENWAGSNSITSRTFTI
jgi:glucuronoarabinoxylan endo-1,4-beta-xylanase